MIIQIVQKKHFKTLNIKTLNKPGLVGKFLNMIKKKSIYEKSTANMILSGERL